MGGQVDNALNNYERVKRYRIRQRARGLCFSCPNPAAEGRSRCATHLAKSAEQERSTRRFGLPLPLVRELGLNTDRRTHADR